MLVLDNLPEPNDSEMIRFRALGESELAHVEGGLLGIWATPNIFIELYDPR